MLAGDPDIQNQEDHLLIFGLGVLLLVAFLACLAWAAFAVIAVFVAFAVVAVVLYGALFFGLYAAFGDVNTGPELLGAFLIGSTILALMVKSYNQAEKERELAEEKARAEAAAAIVRAAEEKARVAEEERLAKVRADEAGRAEKAAARLQAEAEKAARQKSGCPCGSGRTFDECHGMTMRSAFDTAVTPHLKRGWEAIVAMTKAKT